MKHTPGPWQTFSYLDHVAVVFRPVNPRRNGTICDLTGIGGEHDANAHLIAAAPELLKALKPFAHLEISTCSKCDGDGKHGVTDQACTLCGGIGELVVGFPNPHDVRDAKAALAKARQP